MRKAKSIFATMLAMVMVVCMLPLTASANYTTAVTPTVVVDSKAIALKADGSVWTWTISGGEQRAPIKVLDSGFIAVDIAYGRYNVALKADGTLWTWGLYKYNDGEKGCVSPTQIDTGVSQLCCSGSDFKYAKADGTLWRYTFQERRKSGTVNPEERQKLLEGYVSYASSKFTEGLALKSDGSLWEWIMAGIELREVNKIIDNVASFSISNDGANYAMILKDGSLWTMGNNHYGQIGDGTGDWDNSESLNRKNEPVKIMDGVAMATVNTGHGAAVKTDGSLWVWGIGNNRPLLGQEWQKYKDGNEYPKFYAPQKLIDSGIAAISFDNSTIIALKQDGTLLSWGDTRGALGYDASKISSSAKDNQRRSIIVPQPIPGIDNVKLPGAAAATPPAPPAPSLVAKPTSSTVLVNGKNVAFDAYNIGGNNYFKLRDLAYILSDTETQFEVGWDQANNAISLTSGKAYTAVGGEMEGKGNGDKTPTATSSKIYLDGKEVSFTAYNIEGNNYFKLRDVGEAFDFNVSWDGANNTIVIATNESYTAD